MNNHAEKRRRSIRLPGYDYSQNGACFVTICTQNRVCLFGTIVDGEMVLNPFGRIVAEEWIKTGEIRDEIQLDRWVVMPNHFYGIVWIKTTGNGTPQYCRGDRPVAPTGLQPRSLGSLVAGFKSGVTKHINQLRNTPGMTLWQRNYWEHVVRDEDDLNRIRQYITDNPMKWETDRENPEVMESARKTRNDFVGAGV